MKLCKNCKHFDDPYCFRKTDIIDPVYGVKTLTASASLERKEGRCGPEGKFYEPNFFYRLKMFFN